MNHRILLFAGSIAAVSATAGGQRPLTLNVGGGVSLPVAHFHNVANIGWHALASIGVSTYMQPLGLRLDGAYNRFSAKSGGPTPAVTSGTLNFTYRLPMTNSPLSPYVITGVGGYHLGCSGTPACVTSTRFGWNAGLGTKFIAFGLRGFLESRFHAVNSAGGNVRYIPITLGLTF
jgi:hypothetical protein